MSEPFKKYLGDGVYADFDGYHIVLTVEDHQNIKARICLDEDVFAALREYRWQLLATLHSNRESNRTTTGQETP
jgi:hypothetical protein